MQRSKLKETLHEIIFEADTPSGKLFDVGLIISIILSVIAVIADSIGSIQESYGHFLYTIEWFLPFSSLWNTPCVCSVPSIRLNTLTVFSG